MKSRAAWLDASTQILHDLRAAIAPFGIALAPELAVVADPHPCPGYLHDERVIAFCPPVVETVVDRARWMFFCRMMGCASLDEAIAFYEVALPLIVCHEASHHLRMSRGLASSSHFIEEQVCDRMAVAMVEALPHHRSTLGPLLETCEAMLVRLGESFGASPGAAFVPDVGALLVATSRLDRAELDRLEQLAERRGIPLDELLAITASVDDATTARDLARQHVDTRYTENPAEYWHLGLTWVKSYLARGHRPSLADVLQEHLLASDDASRTSEVEGVLHTMLSVPAQRAAAAEGLLALGGAAIAHELAAWACEADDVLEVLVRKWPRDGDWDVKLAHDLFRAPDHPWSVERARLLVRLAGICNIPVPAVEHHEDEGLQVELVAADRTGSRASIGRWLIDPRWSATLLEAWEAHGRGLDELPHDALTTLTTRSTPRVRRAILRLALTLDPTCTTYALAASLAVDELADPLGPATDELDANRIAQVILDRFGIDRACELAWRSLPARGGPAWDQFLAVFERGGAIARDLAGEDARLEVAIRAAAARADLRREGTVDDSRIVALGERLLDHAEQLAEHGRALGADPAAATADALAVEILVMAARRATLEVVRALAPRQACTTIADIADEATRRGPVDVVVRDLLVAAVPAALRARIARCLAGSPPPIDRHPPIELASLPPLARTTLSPDSESMLTIEKLVHIRTVPLFAGVALEQLHEVATRAVVQTYDKGTTIFGEGDDGDRLFLILAGHVTIEKETGTGAITLDRLGPSSCFGEMALFDDTPRSASARALTDCRLLTLSSTAVAQLGRADPQIYESFLRVLSRRLRTSNATVARVTDRTSLA